MTKTQEALDKAKQSGKKIAEGGKELGIGTAEIVLGTSGALSYTLLSSGEKLASKISESREGAEGISAEEKESRKKFTVKYDGKAKKHIVKAGDFGKTAVRGTKKAIKGGAKTVGYTVKGGYHLVDAGDKAIGDYFEKKQKEKGKKAGKIASFFRDNILKLLIATSAIGYGGYKTAETIVDDKQSNKQEIVIDEERENEIIENQEDVAGLSKVERDETYANQGIILVRDNNLSFYVVRPGESLSVIKNKLQKIPEFSYLSSPEYRIPNSGRNIKSFNTPSSSLIPGFYLPIPLKAEDREIDIPTFKGKAKVALNQMKNNKIYGEKTKELLKNVNENEVINIMTAYARSETAEDRSKFSDPIGSVELHRREPKYKAYSFSYFHILMGKGPGMNARKKLGLTEGDCYDATNACKLFLGYCFEKKRDSTYFFDVKNLNQAKNVGKSYNGQRSYGDKLWANIKHVKKIL